MSVDTAIEPGKAPTQIAPTPQLPPSVYKDEGKDTSAVAVERNELGPKSGYPAPEPPQAEPAPAPQVEQPAVEPPAPAEPPKLLAGKYKNVEELERGYLESQKGFQQKVESELSKRLPEATQKAIAQALAQAAGTAQVAQTIVDEKPLSQMTPDEHLELLTKNAAEYHRRQQSETIQMLRAAQVQDEWKRDNSDLASIEIVPADSAGGHPVTGEALVSFMVNVLAKRNPELLNDQTGKQVLDQATGFVRNLLSAERNQGRQEAQVIRETVTSLQATTAPTAARANSAAAPAPAKNVDPLDEEVERQRAELRRVSMGSPVVRR